MLADGLALLRAGHAAGAAPQPEAGVTYAHKLDKPEARLDWTQPAASGAQGARLRTLAGGRSGGCGRAPAHPRRGGSGSCPRIRARHVAGREQAGHRLACGEGALRLRVIQRDGGKAITAADYLNARRDLATRHARHRSRRQPRASSRLRQGAGGGDPSRPLSERRVGHRARPAARSARSRTCWKRSVSRRCASARVTTRPWQLWLRNRWEKKTAICARYCWWVSPRSMRWDCPRTRRCRPRWKPRVRWVGRIRSAWSTHCCDARSAKAFPIRSRRGVAGMAAQEDQSGVGRPTLTRFSKPARMPRHCGCG